MVLPKTAGTADQFGATVQTGPGPSDAGTSTMSATPGIEPFDYTVAGSNGFGQPATFVPWALPLFDPLLQPSASQTGKASTDEQALILAAPARR